MYNIIDTGATCSFLDVGTSVTIIPNTITCSATWAPPEPKVELIDITCPKCGSSHYHKTDIEKILECDFCGSHFGVKYTY